MTAIQNPIDPNRIDGFLICSDAGQGPVGTITDLAWVDLAGTLYFQFDTALDVDIPADDTAIMIFRNGLYATSIPGSATNWSYTPNADSTFESFEFMLVPNDWRWREYLDAPRITNRVRLSWSFNSGTWLANDAKKLIIRYCEGIGTPDTELTTLTRIGAQRNGENGSSSNSAMYASGKWEDPDCLYAEIDLAITKSGDTNEAEYTWAYAGWSGTGICRDYPDHIFNGIKVQFEKAAPYRVGDTWTIVVSLPVSYTSDPLSLSGALTFGVNSINSAGDEAVGPTKAVTVYVPPDAPIITGTPVYVQGSGEIEITWTSPSTVPSPLVSYRVYRNWPYTGIALVDWAWEYSGNTTEGATFTATVMGLEEGFNRICATVVDELGNESDFSLPWEITLNASLNEVGGDPNSPDSISARMLISGDIEVHVVADSTSDLINIYWDDHTGTIDYTTVIATIDNPRAGVFQHLTTTLSSGLTDGIYRIAARGSLSGSEETNTDLWCSVLRDKDAPAVVSGLSATAVAG